MPDETVIQAVVDRIVRNGRHGPYAVAKSPAIGFITFSLDPSVWRETEWPEPGTWVVLSKLSKKRAGWRAKQGRFFKPSDEQLA